MKKLILLALSLSLFTLILSCGGGGVVTPKIAKPEVAMTFFLPSDPVQFGDSIAIAISIKYAGSGTLTTSNGQNIQVYDNDNKTFQLAENTTFTLEASNADGIKATTSKAVTVGSWKDNNLGLLNHQGKHWVRGDVQIIQNGEVVYIDYPGEQAGEYFIYDIDNTFYFYSKDNELYGHNGWRFLENETQIQWFNNNGTEDPQTIVKLTETDLSLSEFADFGDGGTAIVIRNWTIESSIS